MVNRHVGPRSKGGRYTLLSDAARVPSLNVLANGAGSGNDPICPVCGYQVRVRKNGQLSSHRLKQKGKKSREGWPCPGSDLQAPQSPA